MNPTTAYDEAKANALKAAAKERWQEAIDYIDHAIDCCPDIAFCGAKLVALRRIFQDNQDHAKRPATVRRWRNAFGIGRKEVEA